MITPVLESSFNKVAVVSPAIFSKKEALTQVLSCEFCKIFQNTFFAEHLRTSSCGPTK